jgi:hypothetical protein
MTGGSHAQRCCNKGCKSMGLIQQHWEPRSGGAAEIWRHPQRRRRSRQRGWRRDTGQRRRPPYASSYARSCHMSPRSSWFNPAMAGLNQPASHQSAMLRVGFMHMGSSRRYRKAGPTPSLYAVQRTHSQALKTQIDAVVVNCHRVHDGFDGKSFFHLGVFQQMSQQGISAGMAYAQVVIDFP